jgi:general secretion pathway protein B
MSFILDALRKSENERKRNQPPGLADARIHRGNKNRNLWIPLVAVLVGINVSLLIVMWVTSDEPAAPAPASVAAPVATAPTVATAPERPAAVSASPAAGRTSRRLIDELEPEPPQSRATASAPPAAPAATPQSWTPAVTTTTPAQTQNTGDSIPGYTEVVLNGSVNVSPLRLDMHVYSDATEERFIFVNMAKYREGDTLSEGPRVVEITALGVILNQQGTRFLLMRQ